ncbi:hypothetical protein BHM03_00054680 [Ensete ventricosum]|nr:hypothetical protein BHM03_00054680 [Ensete ventricosum]
MRTSNASNFTSIDVCYCDASSQKAMMVMSLRYSGGGASFHRLRVVAVAKVGRRALREIEEAKPLGNRGGNGRVAATGVATRATVEGQRQLTSVERRGGTKVANGSGGVLGRLLWQGRKKGRGYLSGRGGHDRGGGCGGCNDRGSKVQALERGATVATREDGSG